MRSRFDEYGLLGMLRGRPTVTSVQARAAGSLMARVAHALRVHGVGASVDAYFVGMALYHRARRFPGVHDAQRSAAAVAVKLCMPPIQKRRILSKPLISNGFDENASSCFLYGPCFPQVRRRFSHTPLFFLFIGSQSHPSAHRPPCRTR